MLENEAEDVVNEDLVEFEAGKSGTTAVFETEQECCPMV